MWDAGCWMFDPLLQRESVGFRVALSGVGPGCPRPLPGGVPNRKPRHSWQDFLGAPNNPPGAQSFRPLSRSCTLHCRRVILHCILHIRRGQDRTSERLLLPATVLPSLDPHRPASGYWQCACGVFDGGRFALIVRCRASRSTRGTCQAKEYPENMMVNTLPSKTKDTLCISYSRRFLRAPSILAAARLASFSSSSL
jgi:hypothetical protein